MNYDVFVSYSSQSSELAMGVVEHLERGGVHCWVAPRDLAPGGEWAEGIIEGIESCSLFLLILCEQANGSPQVLREVERAVSKKVPIIPLMIGKISLSKSLEYFVSTHHWLQVSNAPSPSELESLSLAVQRKLQGKAAASQVSQPSLERSPVTMQKKRALRLAPLVAFVCMALAFAVYTRRQPVPEPLSPPPLAEKIQPLSTQTEKVQEIVSLPAKPKNAKAAGWPGIMAEVGRAAFVVPISTNKKTFREGDELHIRCDSPRSGYLTIFSHTIGTDKMTMLFPNKAHLDNRVTAGKPIRIPGPDDQYKLKADAATGKTILVAFLHNDPGFVNTLLTGLAGNSAGYFPEVKTREVMRGFDVEAAGSDGIGAGTLELQAVQ